jgi:hypothetical protein
VLLNEFIAGDSYSIGSKVLVEQETANCFNTATVPQMGCGEVECSTAWNVVVRFCVLRSWLYSGILDSRVQSQRNSIFHLIEKAYARPQ